MHMYTSGNQRRTNCSTTPRADVGNMPWRRERVPSVGRTSSSSTMILAGRAAACPARLRASACGDLRWYRGRGVGDRGVAVGPQRPRLAYTAGILRLREQPDHRRGRHLRSATGQRSVVVGLERNIQRTRTLDVPAAFPRGAAPEGGARRAEHDGGDRLPTQR